MFRINTAGIGVSLAVPTSGIWYLMLTWSVPAPVSRVVEPDLVERSVADPVSGDMYFILYVSSSDPASLLDTLDMARGCVGYENVI
jgi:hypothetical protein